MRFNLLLVLYLFAVGTVVAVDQGYTTGGTQSLDDAVADLRAINTEWQRNDTEFRSIRQEGGISATEVTEFAEFVAGLKRQVFEACQLVRELGGDPDRHGVDCKVIEKQSAKQAGTMTRTARRRPTREERSEQLRSELKKLEAEFDGMILIQQAKIREKASTSPTAGGWAKSGAGAGSGDAADGAAVGGAQEDSTERQGESGATPGVKKQGKPPIGQVPGDLGDGSEDDVVARQLREAAEVETDPVLRKQLWDEYKKYKNSIK